MTTLSCQIKYVGWKIHGSVVIKAEICALICGSAGPAHSGCCGGALMKSHHGWWEGVKMAALGHIPVALRLMDMVPLTSSQNIQECHRPQLMQGGKGTWKGFRRSCTVGRYVIAGERDKYISYSFVISTVSLSEVLEINLIKNSPGWFNKHSMIHNYMFA